LVDRAETQLRIEEIATRRAILADAVVSTNDTVTFDNLTTVTSAFVCKKLDGTSVTCSVATNVVTITGAGLTNVPVQIFVNGVP